MIKILAFEQSYSIAIQDGNATAAGGLKVQANITDKAFVFQQGY